MGVNVFLAYAQKDEPSAMKLEGFLAQILQENSSSLRMCEIGQIDKEDDLSLTTADLILLLVSPDFLDSDYCYSVTMAQAIERHKQGETLIIPIILRPVYWGRTPFSRLQALPENMEPITLSDDPETAFGEVITVISTIVSNRGAQAMSPEGIQPIKLFSASAHEDESLRNELARHLALLQRQGFIESWYDGQILPGIEWKSEIEKQLTSARIILLLISSDFFFSDFCYSIEMERALQRHKLGEAWVLPVILRPVDWREAPFAHIPCLPHNEQPITTWSNRDEAFLSVTQGIRNLVDWLRGQPPSVKERPKEEPSAEDPHTKERWLKEGNLLAQAMNYEGALAAYDQALRLDPHLSYAYLHKSILLVKLRRYQEALDACNQALRLDPSNAFAHIEKGAALNRLRRIEEAMIACNEALRLDPYSTYAHSTMGSVLASLGRNKEALAACDKALRLDPNNGDAHSVAGGALINLERHQEAVRAIERALQLDPGDAYSYFNRGQVLLKFRRFQEAITAYDQALRLDPDFFLAYICRGAAYMGLGFPNAALSSVEEGLRRDPSSPYAPMAYEARAEILRNLGYR